MDRIRSAIALNNQGIVALTNSSSSNNNEKNSSNDQAALPSFMQSLVVLQELLAVCNEDMQTADTADETTVVSPISVTAVSLPDSNSEQQQMLLNKVVAFDTFDTDQTVRLDALQIFSAAVIYNISLWYQLQSQSNSNNKTHDQEKAQVLYEKVCLCLPQENGYQAYALMLRALAVHNVGMLYRQVGALDRAHDCIHIVRDMVLSTGNILPQLLDIDGDAFLQSTSMFIVDVMLDGTLPAVAAAAA